MKKQLTAFCFFVYSVVLSFVLASCADSFNEKYPEKSENLASTMGIVYTANDEKVDGYSYVLKGSISNSNGYDIWAFSVKSGVSYSILFQNEDNALMSLSVSTSANNFTSSSYAIAKNQTTNLIQFTAATTGYIYVKVEPSENNASNTGSYLIQIAGGSEWISLTKAKSESGTSSSSSSSDSTITTGSSVPSYAWKSGSISSSDKYDVYYFYAYSGKTYRIFWDDYFEGSNSNVSSFSDICVTASTSSSDFTSSSYVFSSCNAQDSGYSSGKAIYVTSSGYIYLKVYPYSSTNHSTGSYRLAVTYENTYTTLTKKGTYSNTISADDVSSWTDGTISSSTASNIYRFYAYSGYSYSVFWQDYYDKNSSNYLTADILVSAASDSVSYFTSVDNGYTSSKTITPTESGYIYLTVSSTSYKPSGSYQIAVVRGGSASDFTSVTLYLYSETQETVNPYETISWTDGTLPSTSDYVIYQFYASANASYYVFWDDYSDGLMNKYSSSGADIYVSASSSRSNFTSSSYCYFTAQDSGYSIPSTITAASSGYIYLKVYAPARTGSYRIGVLKGSSSLTNINLSVYSKTF